jgi:hypothetical protein
MATVGAEANFEPAMLAAAISILLGGMLFGVGIGFSLRRIRLLGAEEIGQGIISAALVGALFTFSAILDSSVSSIVPSSGVPACPAIQNPTGSPHSYYSCHLQSLSDSLSSLFLSLSRTAGITGFASSLRLDVGVVSAQPFFALEEASHQLSAIAGAAGTLSSLASAELQAILFLKDSALAVFLPAGLLLRTFFATRKLGAAAMAIAISAYAVYPLLFLHTFSASQSSSAAQQAFAATDSFNSKFASISLLDLDETSSVRDKMDEMGAGDFGGQVQPILPLSQRALFLSLGDLLLFPLVSLIISAVAALELYHLLSAPIFLPYFENI